MTELTEQEIELLTLFAGKRKICNVRRKRDYINFDVRRHNLDTETTETTDCHHVCQNDFAVIKEAFGGILQNLSHDRLLLQILWIREIKLAMGPLMDEEVYDIIQNAFAHTGIAIDDETVADEIVALERGNNYLEGNEKEVEGELIRVYSLTDEGKNVAEAQFEKMKTFISSRVEFSPIALETKNTLNFQPVLQLADKQKRKKTQSTGQRNKPSKYEELTKAYLDKVVADIREASDERKRALQSRAANLTPMDVADALKDSFKAKIENVEERVRKTSAWKNRKETLKPAMQSFYNTSTFVNRQNTKSHFREVQ